MCFLIGIDRAGEENERKRVKWTGVSIERWSESEEDANRDGGVYMSAGKRGNTIHQSTNNFPWSDCAPSFFFHQVFGSEVKQQVSDWHCTDVWHEGVNRACWDYSFPPDPSLDTCGPLKLVTVELTNSILHRVNEGKAGVCCPKGDVQCASAIASVKIDMQAPRMP